MNLLKEAGLVASPFDANELFDLDLKVIQSSIKTAFIERKALVGEIPSYRHPTVPDPVSSPQIGSTRAAAIKITEAETDIYGSDRPYHQIGGIDQQI
ncbi:hypothetical protein PF006_g33525 [Phytophthora fragariae]|nr:hypothetical protein PF006_g33525 [Phytophthora fragariae]